MAYISVPAAEATVRTDELIKETTKVQIFNRTSTSNALVVFIGDSWKFAQLGLLCSSPMKLPHARLPLKTPLMDWHCCTRSLQIRVRVMETVHCSFIFWHQIFSDWTCRFMSCRLIRRRTLIYAAYTLTFLALVAATAAERDTARASKRRLEEFELSLFSRVDLCVHSLLCYCYCPLPVVGTHCSLTCDS